MKHDKSTPALVIRDLTKKFGDKTAVNSISLVVPAGSFFGLVGPNGAGKTTTLSMATGLLRPDTGTAEIFGVNVWSQTDTAMGLLGLLPDSLALPERLTGGEILQYMGELRGLDRATVRERSWELLQVLGLSDETRVPVMDYSTGMRKKISLALALLHAPKLLVLDEPFEAVDPVSATTIKTILKRFVVSGGSIIFSSHVMALVEELCDHVAIISAGQLRQSGTLEAVKNGQSLEQRFVELVEGRTDGQEGLEWLAA